MKNFRFIAAAVILLLALFPMASFAATGHEGHGGAYVSPLKQEGSAPSAGQSMYNPNGSAVNAVDHSRMDHSKMDHSIMDMQIIDQPAGRTGPAQQSAPGGSHDGHGPEAEAPKDSSSGSHDNHDRQGPAAGSEKSAGGHSGHGGESGPNPLLPVKNEIVAGFAIFNGIIIIAAMVMKNKSGM